MALMGTCRYIRLDGELTSVKISQDSQFALINRASEHGPAAVRARHAAHIPHQLTPRAGDTPARPEHAAGRAQVFGAQPVEARHPELLRRRGGQLHRQRERRCVSTLPLSRRVRALTDPPCLLLLHARYCPRPRHRLATPPMPAPRPTPAAPAAQTATCTSGTATRACSSSRSRATATAR